MTWREKRLLPKVENLAFSMQGSSMRCHVRCTSRHVELRLCEVIDFSTSRIDVFICMCSLLTDSFWVSLYAISCPVLVIWLPVYPQSCEWDVSPHITATSWKAMSAFDKRSFKLLDSGRYVPVHPERSGSKHTADLMLVPVDPTGPPLCATKSSTWLRVLRGTPIECSKLLMLTIPAKVETMSPASRTCLFDRQGWHGSNTTHSATTRGLQLSSPAIHYLM